MVTIDGAAPAHGADLTQTLRRASVLGRLETDELADVIAHARLRHLRRGELLRLQGAPCDQAFVLGDGLVKEHVLTEAGDDVVVDVRGPGQVVGLRHVLGDDHGGTSCVTTLTRADVLVLRGEDVRGWVRSSPRFAVAVTAYLADRSRQDVDDRVRMVNGSAHERVVRAILQMADRWGRAVAVGVEVSVPLTQEELSSWVGVSRETTSKVLHALRDVGAIETGRRRLVVLDRARVERELRGARDEDLVVFTDGDRVEVVHGRP